MEYTIIETKKQYKEYCNRLKELAFQKPTNKINKEIELVELLINKWDFENNKNEDMDPIELLKYLMENRNMKPIELASILNIQKSYVSLILNKKKGLSKEIIRKLATVFKVSQEAFNRSYALVSHYNIGHKDEKMMNTEKELVIA